MRRILALTLVIFAGTMGCATRPQISAADQLAVATAVAAGRWRAQEGTASWYGSDFHGRPTSNGELYNMYTHTAAHKTLPFNTVVRVTHLTSGAFTEVRINDRGPFVGNRIIDLSMAAARDLDMVRTGIAPVRIEIVRAGDPPPVYLIQIGSYREYANARNLLDRLRNNGFGAELRQRDGLTRVVIPDLDTATADRVQQNLRERGFPEGLRVISNR